MNIYDLIIIGAGPAGLTASIYASRYKVSNLVIGKQLGGELSLAHNVCNFPGFDSISGLELAEKMKNQAEKLGAKVLLQEVQKVVVEDLLRSADSKKFSPVALSNKPRSDHKDKGGPLTIKKENFEQPPRKSSIFRVIVSESEIYEAKAVIVATGSERRRLNVPGEKEYLGRGVSYCVVCDGAFFRDKIVAVVGGSDAAVSGAIHLNDHAKKVYIIYRGDQLRAEPAWIEEWKKLEKSGKGEMIYKTNIKEILGDGTMVNGVKLDNPYQGKDVLALDGVFIEIGGVPGTTLVQPLGIKIDETGHVVVNEEMKTNIPGLFCAGDMTSKSIKFKQATLAIGQGSLAAASAYQYLKKQTAPSQRGI